MRKITVQRSLTMDVPFEEHDRQMYLSALMRHLTIQYRFPEMWETHLTGAAHIPVIRWPVAARIRPATVLRVLDHAVTLRIMLQAL